MKSATGSTASILKQPEIFDESDKTSYSLYGATILSETAVKSPPRSAAVRIFLIVLRVLALLACLYFFVCSLDLMSAAFRLVGGRQVGEILAQNVVFQNPIACLMIGVLLTVLVQSSSTSTSLIITMVAAEILQLDAAVYMIMGANIGTSVTNTIVSLGQMGDREELERAFAGATVHDMFNWLTVLVLLPIEMASHALTLLTAVIVDASGNSTVSSPPDFLKVLTSPFTDLVIRLDSSVLRNPDLLRNENVTMIKICCDKACNHKCPFMFMNVAGEWADAAIGGILLALSLAGLIGCLLGLVKILRSLLESNVKTTIERVTRTDNRCALIAMDYIGLVVGACLTILVQSSSVLTSALTPLVGTGIITVEIMYPMTLGSNIGTTTTGLLAAMASGNPISLQTALVHLFFNVFGVLLWLPLPFLKMIPIALAKKLGAISAEYRWFPIAYLIVMFGVLPMIFFGLSFLHEAAVYAAFGLIVLPMLLVGLISLLQAHAASCLPEFLRNWDFVTQPLASCVKSIERACCRKRNQIDAADDPEAGNKEDEGTV